MMRPLRVAPRVNSVDFTQWRETFASSADALAPHVAQPLIMGILNLTPDSFSDGGCFLERDRALRHAETMIAEGADLLDIGGESSRPGASPVSCETELSRVVPVIESLRAYQDVTISIDTNKPQVMRAAVEAGASFINDTQALQAPGALAAAAELQVPVCLMHMQGQPHSMQLQPHYEQGVLQATDAFFAERIQACLTAGIPRQHLILDPGFGFGKTVDQNLWLTKHVSTFRSHKLPLLLGFSRKSTIGSILKQTIEHRLLGGVSLAVYAILQGVSIIRTHDVGATKQALQMVNAVMNGMHEGEQCV